MTVQGQSTKTTAIVQRFASSYVRPVFLPFYPVGEFMGPATDDCALPFCEIIGRVARRRRACRTIPESHQRMVSHNPYDSAFFPKPSAPGEKLSDRQRFRLSARCLIQLFRCHDRLVAVFADRTPSPLVIDRRTLPGGSCCDRTYTRALASCSGSPSPA